jgi:hypothetical protein
VRHDLRAGRAERVVAAGVRRMPVRVQQRADRRAAGALANQRGERGGLLRRAAVDDRRGRPFPQQHDVAAGAADQREPVAQRCLGQRRGRLGAGNAETRAEPKARRRQRRGAERETQEAPPALPCGAGGGGVASVEASAWQYRIGHRNRAVSNRR